MKTASEIYQELKDLIILEFKMQEQCVRDEIDQEEKDKRLYCLQSRIRTLEEILELV